MGVARGFRQAVAGDAGQRQFDGCLETHAMADGDVHRLHAGARAHCRPDGLCAIDERRPRSFDVWRFVMLAGEPGLGRPDGGDIQQHPEMAGEAEAARVRDALGVAEDEIGSDLQPGQGRQRSRQLAECKQSGHIGECRRATGHGCLHQLQAWICEHGHRRARHAPSCFVAHVHTCHVPDRRQAVVAFHPLAQFILQHRGLGRRQLPRVFDYRLHGPVARAAPAAAVARKYDWTSEMARQSSMRCRPGF